MVMEITVKPEYNALLPPLSSVEYEALKNSINENGLYIPITVNGEGVVLDGHHRYRACTELDIECRYEVKDFVEPLIEKLYVIDTNLKRRNLTDFQKAELGKERHKIETELAKQRQINLGKTHGTYPLSSNELKGQARDIVAEKVGLSPTTYQRARVIMERGTEELKEDLRSGEKSISAGYNEIRNIEKIEARKQQILLLEEKVKDIPPLEGTFNVIVVDPPWAYGTRYHPEGRRGSAPYPEMSLEEIEAIELPFEDNCVLWLWTTNAFIHEAFHIIEAWGFEHKTVLTWVKNKMGVGYWLRGKTEHCIMAVKGKPLTTLTNETTVIYGDVREHSQKPDEFYELVDKLCHGRKLDYFARKERDGWTTYGTKEE